MTPSQYFHHGRINGSSIKKNSIAKPIDHSFIEIHPITNSDIKEVQTQRDPIGDVPPVDEELFEDYEAEDDPNTDMKLADKQEDKPAKDDDAKDLTIVASN